MSHDESTQDPAKSAPQEVLDDPIPGQKRERRKRYPGILSKVAAGAPENAALAVLKGELDLPVLSVSAVPDEAGGSDEKK